MNTISADNALSVYPKDILLGFINDLPFEQSIIARGLRSDWVRAHSQEAANVAATKLLKLLDL